MSCCRFVAVARPSHFIQFCSLHELFKLIIEIRDQLLIELQLAQGAIPLILTPGQDALTMEVVPRIARQGCDHLARFEHFHANGALCARRVQESIVLALVQSEQAKRLSSSHLLVLL